MSFKRIALEKSKSVNIAKDKERIKLAEMITRYPDGVTITAFQRLVGENGVFFVFTFDEEPTAYFAGCTTLDKLANAWLDDHPDQTIEETNEELAAEGGVKIRMFMANAKSGRQYVNYEVL